jgi:zinc/manganese transport system ATP-binding protein
MLARSEVLAVRQVSVSLSGHSILKDIDFTLESGEFCGLIGANGSGKTTLLRALLGFVAPSSGSVSVDGGGSLASVGYVPQKFVLDPYIPARARPCRARSRRQPIGRAAALAGAPPKGR